MTIRLSGAALAAVAALWLAPAHAGCVIAPDGKSIDVVTDNPTSDGKSCSVSCQVDTKIGVVQVACGGTTPPLAKAHSLCNFDKPEPWYKKVISAKDSCAGAPAAAAPAPAQAAAAVKPGTFICRIAPDGKSFAAMIANPYAAETSCQVNCQISTTRAGTTEQSSCTKNVAPGVGEAVLCSHTIAKGKFVKVVGGSGKCTDPTPRPAKADKDDDAQKDVDALMQSMQKLPKPPAAAKTDDVDMQAIASDPAKMREFMRKQLSPEDRKLFDEMNKP
jgi:hypothetical protein